MKALVATKDHDGMLKFPNFESATVKDGILMIVYREVPKGEIQTRMFPLGRWLGMHTTSDED